MDELLLAIMTLQTASSLRLQRKSTEVGSRRSLPSCGFDGGGNDAE